MTRTKFLTAIAILFALTSCAHAESVNIIELGEGNFTTMGSTNIVISGEKGATIQAALNVIPAGGTITLNGDFKLNRTLQLSKNVTIRSAGTSRLYGDSTFGLADLSGDITLENLIFDSGYDPYCGGGLYITGSGNITLKGCVIRQCKAGCYGAGVFVSPTYTGTLELTDCEISENIVSGYETEGYGWGGGLCIYCGSLALRNCYIHDNYAYYMGGGVFVGENASAGADAACVISGNTSTAYPQFSDVCNYSAGVSASSIGDIDVEASRSQSGCNASGLGVVLLAAVFTLRRRPAHAKD